MTATMIASDRPSLFNTSSNTLDSDLVLRVLGSRRNGQVVRLKSAKCTIGSGPHCTLRLRASGVAPMHCLLLRGRAGTVARCWSADTRLNDKSFTDAIVSSGDRLAIGPIELEVLNVGTISPIHNLEIKQEESRQHVDEDRKQLAARSAELELQQDLLTAERNGLEAQRNALAEDRRQWQAECESTKRSLDDNSGQLAARLTEIETERNSLDSQRNALAEERRQWQAECESTKRSLDDNSGQLAARLAEIETGRNSLGAQRNALTEERRQWQAECESTKRSLDDNGGQLAARLTEIETERSSLETQRNALAEERRQWQAECENAKRSLDDNSGQLSARLAEIETERNTLAEERRQWQAECESAKRSLDDNGGQLAARLAEIETERNALAEERLQWQAEQATDMRNASEQLAARTAELEAERNASAVAKKDLEERRQEESQRVELPPIETPVAKVEPSLESPAEELRFQEPTEHAPVSLSDVFRRVGAKIDLSEEEQKEEQAVKTPPARVAPQHGTSRSAPDKVSVLSASDGAGGEEESIDDYMHKLMQRVRGSSGESETTPAAKRPEPIRATREASTVTTAADLSTPAASTSDSPPSEPVVVQPRAPSPAKHIDLSSLRELANLSANNAISQHARRVMVRAMYSKLLVAIVATVAGAGLFWLWKQYGASEITLYASLVAVVVAAFWGIEYALLSGRLIVNKAGHINIDWNTSATQRDNRDSSATENGVAGHSAAKSPSAGGIDSRLRKLR